MKISRDQKRRRDKNKHIVIDHGSGIKNPWPIFLLKRTLRMSPPKAFVFKGLCGIVVRSGDSQNGLNKGFLACEGTF